MNEVWKPVVGLEGLYEVSNIGTVRSLPRVAEAPRGRKRLIAGGMMKLHDRGGRRKGYISVVMCLHGKHKNALVHRLVASAFIPNPESLPQVNHIDGNKANNAVQNLEWVTAKQNHDHAIVENLYAKAVGDQFRRAKLNREAVAQIRALYAAGVLERELADRYGVLQSTISKAVRMETWKHVT